MTLTPYIRQPYIRQPESGWFQLYAGEATNIGTSCLMVSSYSSYVYLLDNERSLPSNARIVGKTEALPNFLMRGWPFLVLQLLNCPARPRILKFLELCQ